MSLELIKCSRCGNDFPKKRKDLYGYDFCVKCSDVAPVVGRVVVIGEGDYTATELDVLDQTTARRLQELENLSKGVKNVPVEILNFEEETVSDDAKALEEAVHKVLDEDLVEEIEDEEEIEEDIYEEEDED